MIFMILSKNPIETVRNLAASGATLTTRAAAEVVRHSTNAPIGAANFLARQALRGLDLGVNVVGYGVRAVNSPDNSKTLLEPGGGMSTQDALSKLATTLATTTTGETLEEDFERVVYKISHVGTVIKDIRMHQGDKGIVPMSCIAQELVDQVVTIASESDITAPKLRAWVEILHDQTGVDGVDSAYL
jgi:hypothetical protein